MINILFNGQQKQVAENLTIEQFIKSQQESLPKMFVVEKNREIIYKEKYATENIDANDEIEIVGFCGGG